MVNMNHVSLLLVTLMLTIGLKYTEADHFTGAFCHPEYHRNTNKVIAHCVQSFKKDNDRHDCDAAKVQSNTSFVPTQGGTFYSALTESTGYEGAISATPSGARELACINYDRSSSNYWIIGEKDVVFARTNPKFLIIGIDCCWVDEKVQEGDSNWFTATIVNTSLSQNECPKTAKSAVAMQTLIKDDTIQTITIPVIDADKYRCRLSTGYSECGDICDAINVLDGEILDHCTLQVDTSKATENEYYPVSIQIEDLDEDNNDAVKCSVGLQFLLQIKSVPNFPKFANIVEPSGTKFFVTRTSPINVVLYGTSKSSLPITDFVIDDGDFVKSLPTEPTTVDCATANIKINGLPSDTSCYKASFQWTPKPDDEYQFFCFRAEDSAGTTTPRYCYIYIIVDSVQKNVRH